MARVPMVTRTITTTKVNVMCLDITEGEPRNEVVTVPRTYKDDQSLLKKVKQIIENDELKAVHIVSKEEIETLYGMTEDEFIATAKVLPSRKVTEAVNVSNNEEIETLHGMTEDEFFATEATNDSNNE